MTALVHEIWESIEDGMTLHTCCFAGDLGITCRELLPASARLLITFVANCHFDAMTIYHRFLDREPYSTDQSNDHFAYPTEWLALQGSSSFQRHGEFTKQWFELGIVNDGSIRELNAQRDNEDNNPEHLRYGSFQRFIASKRPLAAELCRQLYDLGNADVDKAMGGAMMADVLRLPECPQELLVKASVSDRKHIARIASQRLESIRDDSANNRFNRSRGPRGF